MTTIGDRIRQRRIALNMSQEELGKKLGYKSRSSINKIEMDGRNLVQSKIKAIADALDTTPSYIMGWTDEADGVKAHAIDALIRPDREAFYACNPEFVKDDEQAEKYYMDEEAADLAQFAFENPEYKVLFDASRKVKPDDIKKALRALNIFTEEE